MITAAVLARVRARWGLFESAGSKYGIDPALLAGIASRETNVQNIIGDGGHGHGLMQIDDRSHGLFTSSPLALNEAANIDYGAGVLHSYYRQALSRGLSGAAALRAAVAGYNAGAGRCIAAVLAGHDPDVYTTGHDYSRDVLDRAAAIRAALGGGDSKKKLMPVWAALTAALFL